MPWGLDVFVRTPNGVAGSVPLDGVCEFPTDYIKATPEVLCGVYQPTFLYEILWNCAVALVVVLVDRRFTLCLLYTSPSQRDGLLTRMPSSAGKKKKRK